MDADLTHAPSVGAVVGVAPRLPELSIDPRLEATVDHRVCVGVSGDDGSPPGAGDIEDLFEVTTLARQSPIVDAHRLPVSRRRRHVAHPSHLWVSRMSVARDEDRAVAI